MNITMRRFIFLLLLLGLFVSTAAAQSTLFLVRHAEKANSGGNDPDLSTAGHARADTLATMLKDAGLSAIYTTEFKRTQQTAAPVAKIMDLTPTIVPAKDSAALIAKLRNPGGNVLVVGHSNTIPELIKALGIATPISLADDDYDNLFVIALGPEPRLLRLHYH
jgi:broad specificity phosphatase PhoE